MDFESLISRADEEVLQTIVGAPTVRVLNLLEPELATPSRLRALILDRFDPADVLLDPNLRPQLTDLLTEADASELAGILGLDRADPYPALRSLRVRAGSSRERELLGAFGVDVPEPPEEQVGETLERVGADYSLFPHQRRALRSVMHVLDGAERRVLLHMPTGSGKTRTAMHAVADQLRRGEPSLVVWLAYSEELCSQASEEFARAWAHLGDREVALYRYWGGHDLDLNLVRDGLLVAGLSKLYSAARREALPLLGLADRASLVIIDEAHQAVAETYQFLLDVMIERDRKSRLLGLSATPGRSWNDVHADEELAHYFLRQKVTLSVEGYANPVDFLVEEGYLARPTFRALTYGGGKTLSDIDLRELERELDVSPKILKLLADDEQRNLLIVNAVEQLAQRHKRILVFAGTVQHAQLLAGVLSSRGHLAEAVTGATPRDVRRRSVDRFRDANDETRILCNFGVLTTGFDAPRTSAAVIARPTKSLVLYSQMVGRATRGTRAGGNSSSEIVTVVDTGLPGFGDMGEAFNNWEDVW